MTRKFALAILAIAWSCLSGNAQVKFSDRIVLAAKADLSKTLFLHLDKTLYTNNETIFFSAYLLEDFRAVDPIPKILSVTLINKFTKDPTLSKEFPLRNGLSFGSLTLPDTIPPGSYTLIAFTADTSTSGDHMAKFEQNLTIKSFSDHAFSSSLVLLDSNKVTGPFKAEVTLEFPKAMNKDAFSFHYTTHNQDETVKILKAGKNLIDLWPKKTDSAHGIFTGVVYHNYESRQYLTLNLPTLPVEQPTLIFYPESGYIVKGQPATVGFELKKGGSPMSGKVYLFRNSELVDSTLSTIHGIGRFRILQGESESYFARVEGYPDKPFVLAAPLSIGVTLNLRKAVVNDTLQLQLLSSQTPGKLIIHNYRDVFGSIDIQGSKNLSILLDAVPTGVTALTFVDPDGRPLAERLFFAHHDRLPKLELLLDSAEYGARQDVSVTIKSSDHLGKPVQGIVSGAVVQMNRLELQNGQDIESYVILGQTHGRLPSLMQGQGIPVITDLEDVLLVKGWRKYIWLENNSAAAGDSLMPLITKYSGQTFFNKKVLNEPVELILQTAQGLKTITTNKDGSFEIDPDDLLLQDAEKITVMVNKKNKFGYTISFKNPFTPQIKRLADGIVSTATPQLKFSTNGRDQQITLPTDVVKIETVSIKRAKYDENIFGTKALSGSNDCGDYVDIFSYLNYPHNFNKAGNTQPVKGKSYLLRTDINFDPIRQHGTFSVRQVVYMGCLTTTPPTTFNLNGIYLQKEFYGLNNDNPAPQHLSTLFWKSGILTNKDGEAKITFKTGDLKGPFKVVVQGAGLNEVLFSQAVINVK